MVILKIMMTKKHHQEIRVKDVLAHKSSKIYSETTGKSSLFHSETTGIRCRFPSEHTGEASEAHLFFPQKIREEGEVFPSEHTGTNDRVCRSFPQNIRAGQCLFLVDPSEHTGVVANLRPCRPGRCFSRRPLRTYGIGRWVVPQKLREHAREVSSHVLRNGADGRNTA